MESLPTESSKPDAYSSVCSACARLKHGGAACTCEAFPQGIPRAIWDGDNDHTEPYPDDHGLQFEPRQKS